MCKQYFYRKKHKNSSRPWASSASNQVTTKQISGLRTGPAYNLVELCNVIEGTAIWAVGLAGSVA